jgi:hypothetical protein
MEFADDEALGYPFAEFPQGFGVSCSILASEI